MEAVATGRIVRDINATTSQDAPKVTIIIVSYNTRELTEASLRCVREHVKGISYELFIVDNASSDGSVEAIREAASLTPGTRLWELKENIGFAAANNLAAKEARGEYILLLNPDTLLLDDAVSALVQFAEAHPQAGIWGGRTLYEDRSLNPSSCWRRMTLWGLFCGALGLRSMFRRSAIFNTEGYGGWMRDEARHVDIVTGCLLMISRALWNEIGGFDAAFFMYGEDADLCMKARARGYRPMITPAATIIHYGGRSERSRPDKIISLLRARQMLIRRYWSPVAAPIGLFLLRVSILSRRIAHGLFGSRKNESGDERLGKWTSVWRRRGEWVS